MFILQGNIKDKILKVSIKGDIKGHINLYLTNIDPLEEQKVTQIRILESLKKSLELFLKKNKKLLLGY